MEWEYCYECKHNKRKYNQKPCNNCMEDGISNWEKGETDEEQKKYIDEIMRSELNDI